MRTLLSSLLLAASVSFADAQGACEPEGFALLKADMFAAQMNGEVLKPLEGDRAKRYVAFVNGIEPKSDHAADKVVIVAVPGRLAAIVLIKAGCVEAYYTLPWPAHVLAMRATDGEPA